MLLAAKVPLVHHDSAGAEEEKEAKRIVCMLQMPFNDRTSLAECRHGALPLVKKSKLLRHSEICSIVLQDPKP